MHLEQRDNDAGAYKIYIALYFERHRSSGDYCCDK